MSSPPVHRHRSGVLALVERMRSERLVAAPHVLRDLLRRLGGDLRAAAFAARVLTDGQRRGVRPLPADLPVEPSVIEGFERIPLNEEEWGLLSVIAFRSDDRLGLIEAVVPANDRVWRSRILREQVRRSSGEIRFRDPRFGFWLRAVCTEDHRREAHRRLAEAHEACGQADHACWHRSRAGTGTQPRHAAELLRISEELLRAGEAEAAFHVAVEAIGHTQAVPLLAARSRVAAARAALGACWFEESIDLLAEPLVESGSRVRLQVMMLRLIAQTYARGVIPFADPTRDRPRADDAGEWQDWARICAYTACFCAVHGAHQHMRLWLGEVREADMRSGRSGAFRDPAVAFCWLLSGEEEGHPFSASGPFSEGVVAALQYARDGQLDRALRAVRRGERTLGEDTEAFISGFERTPLILGLRKTLEVLLLTWKGQIGSARAALIAGAVRYPVAPHFLGLGAALARRLDLVVDGELSAFSAVMTECAPGEHRPEGLVDEALGSFLAGDHEEAARCLRLWNERGAPRVCFDIPGLDEVGPVIEHAIPGTPEAAQARTLVRRARLLPDSEWQREHSLLSSGAKDIRAPFFRGRVEAVLGVSSAIRGERELGRRHLRTACTLFDEAGAGAWRAFAAHRLHLLGRDTVHGRNIDEDPLASCRAVWEGILTERELEVAMLAVQGATNRSMAERFGVSVRTIEVHMGHIFAKFEVKNRSGLAALAHRTNRFA